jgi:3D (Asp-Asp-Asp) domain-containing protein
MNTQNNKSKSINLYGVSGLLLALNLLMFPATSDKSALIQQAVASTTQASIIQVEAKSDTPATPAKPEIKIAKSTSANRVIYVTVTAYSSTPDQTDDTPFITANGTHVRDGIIAANFLRFGTKVKFPDYSGDKIYEVTDRMNARYPDRADIWMETRGAAIDFGVRTLKMEILPATPVSLADKN